jgi:hypothetical protein
MEERSKRKTVDEEVWRKEVKEKQGRREEGEKRRRVYIGTIDSDTGSSR